MPFMKHPGHLTGVMAMSERQLSTADVRPIGDVIHDLRRLLVSQLAGAKTPPAVMAAWSTVNQCAELVRAADDFDDESPADMRYRAVKAGEHYAAATILRKVADAFGVSNFRDGSVGRV